MKFMNTWEIENAVSRYAGHPVLGPATRTLDNLCQYANENSDGWAYWPKPARAAAKLMAFIESDRTTSATRAAYRQALAPIKAFRTRQQAEFDIEEI